jgi:hypothetical protein
MNHTAPTPDTLDSFYRPGGYPSLGLSPLGLEFSTRSSAATQRRLIKHERAWATPLFRAHGFNTLGVRQANELASVFVALRQRFPGVFTDWLNVSWAPRSARFSGLLGLTLCHDELEVISGLAYQLDEPSIMRVLERAHEVGDDELVRQAYREYNHELFDDEKFIRGLYRRDVRAHGTLMLTSCLGHPRCASALETSMLVRERTYNSYGEITAMPLATSYLAALVSHEFAHLIETALCFLGDEAVEHVFAALDEALLYDEKGRRLVGRRSRANAGLSTYDAKLMNYPHPGPRARSRQYMRDDVRRVVGHVIATQLGTYAAKDRWELFAEAFSFSFCAGDPELRAKLAPLHVALKDVGIEAKRRKSALV